MAFQLAIVFSVAAGTYKSFTAGLPLLLAVVANSTSSPTPGLQCITVDLGDNYDLEEISLWLYWPDGRKFNDNTLSVGSTNKSGTLSLDKVLHNFPGTTGYNEISLGRRYTAWD